MPHLPRHEGLGAFITKIAKSTQLTTMDVHSVVTDLIKTARSYADAKYRIKMPPDILSAMRAPKPPKPSPIRLRHRNRPPIIVINNKIRPRAFSQRLPKRGQIDMD